METKQRKQLRYALTLHTPWDQAILYGDKRVENRKWAPKALECPEWIALHAGLTHDEMATYQLEREGLYTFNEQLHKPGYIVGLIRIAGWSRYDDPERDHANDPWASGPICWHIDRVLAFESPVMCSGQRMLWEIPYGKIDAVRQTANAQMNKIILLRSLNSKTCSCGETIYMVPHHKTHKQMPMIYKPGGPWSVVEGCAVHVGAPDGQFDAHWADCPHSARYRGGRP